MNGKIENNICEAIQLLAKKAVQEANYDKTIQASVVECLDEASGKYRVKYQNSYLDAFTNNLENKYPKNTMVYILIPNGDFKLTKTIIGSTDKIKIDLSYNIQEQDLLNPIGINNIRNYVELPLNSYKDSIDILYDISSPSFKKISIDEESLKEFLSKNDYLRIGFKVKTQIPEEQRFQGNYGLFISAIFKDNYAGEEVEKNFILDINDMQGNPYQTGDYLSQSKIFKIDGKNFVRIKQIGIFSENFYYQEENKEDDIFFKDIEMQVMSVATQKTEKGVSLSLLTPEGSYFKTNDEQDKTLSIKALLAVNGRNVSEDQEISFYWFEEDLSIVSTSKEYNSIGGEGWKCLNKFNTISNFRREWIPGENNIVISKRDCYAKKKKYKCVAAYEKDKISQVVEIQNAGSNFELSIESDLGTEFYYDGGNPTLTCKINGEEILASNFNYIWGEEGFNKDFRILKETTGMNLEFSEASQEYEKIKKEIQEETRYENQSKDLLQHYENIIKKYDKILRVEKNKLIKIPVNTITDYTNFKCSVYKDGQYLGTATKKLTNTFAIKGAYNIVLKNGNIAYKYNEAGISPCSKALEKPLDILPLTFKVYNDKGIEIDSNCFKDEDIEWITPSENTLIQKLESENKKEYKYKIAERYNKEKQNNQIKLRIKYKNSILEQKTNFTFLKEGEDGTNGSDVFCRIVPNSSDLNFNKYPMILNGELNFPIKGNKNQWFKVVIWDKGEEVFEGNQEGTAKNGKRVRIKWSILKNHYDLKLEDKTDITIVNEKQGLFSYKKYEENTAPCNIINCQIEYNQKVFYATLPLTTAKMDPGYRIEIEGGYQRVAYNSYGAKPQYNDEKPFELRVFKTINGIEEEISRLTKTEGINYEWQSQGKIYNFKLNSWTPQLTLEKNNDKILERNQIWYTPTEEYKGECLNNALECSLKDSTQSLIGSIHIPIYMYLNRYNNAAINGWDGNHISIDKNNSGMILAPQIGAGKKESDNSFSGLVMGEVKEAGQDVPDNGLIGYHKGERTLYISAYDGYALLGKKSAGQITLDPTSEKALLYSGNFWNEYYTDNEEDSRNGLPITDYSYDEVKQKYKNQNSEGMLIDLTTPRITFGSGNFRVDPQGYLYAKGGGTIGGWEIKEDSLTAGNIILRSDGSLSGGEEGKKWYINTDGTSSFEGAVIQGEISASKGTIGGWEIKEDRLQTANSTCILNSNGSVKLGQLTIDEGGQVSATGLKATGATIDGTITTNNLIVTGGTFTGGDSTEGAPQLAIDKGVIVNSTFDNGTLKNVVITGGQYSGTLNSVTAVEAFSVNNLSATGGTLSGMTATDMIEVSGKITSKDATITGGTIGGCQIDKTSKMLKIKDINLEGKISKEHLPDDLISTTSLAEQKIGYSQLNGDILEIGDVSITNKKGAGLDVGKWEVGTESIMLYNTDSHTTDNLVLSLSAQGWTFGTEKPEGAQGKKSFSFTNGEGLIQYANFKNGIFIGVSDFPL